MKTIKQLLITLLIIIFPYSNMLAKADTIRLTLEEAVILAQLQSVDAAVAMNRLKTSYWEYRTHQADQLPEVKFTGTLPAYNNNFGRYQQSDGSYTYVQNNWMSLNGKMSINQNVALTGGTVRIKPTSCRR